jgi:hypothetical protein
MSTVPSTSTSHSDFAFIFNAALEAYKRKTRKDLASHPLLPSLQSCDSSEAILTVLREQIPGFSESQNGDDGLTKWVTPTVNVLYSLSGALGGIVGLVNIRMFSREVFFFLISAFQAFPPASIISTGIGVLLLVGILHVSLVQPILIPMTPRRPKTPALAETSSLTSLTASNISFAGSRFTPASHRLWL